MTANLPSLYPDQMEIVNEVRDAFRTHQTVILQSPTGSGKSRMGAYMAASSLARGNTVLFDVPMKELRKQIGQTFRDVGIDHSYIASGQRFNPFSHCWISTTPTIQGRLDRTPPIKFALIDEGHQGGAGRDKLKSWLRAQGAKILILTATPERLDGKPVDSDCDCLVMGKSIEWLIDNKRLGDYRLFTPNQPDLSALRRTASGEYNESDAASFMESQSVITGDAVRHYKNLAMGKRNVSYCVSVKHSQMVTQAFRDAGIPSAHIDGSMSDAERDKIIRAYARREILNLSNCDLLLYGFDLAQASGDKNAVVESISDLKPTMSKAMQFQKVGRALRYKDYPAILCDHAGNTFNPDGSVKHGRPIDPVDWQWKGRIKRLGEGGSKSIPVRQCSVCYGVMRPKPICQFCGHVFPISERTISEVDGDLIEVSREVFEQVKREERMNQGRAKTLPELIELGKRRGVSNPVYWAKKVFEGRRKS